MIFSEGKKGNRGFAQDPILSGFSRNAATPQLEDFPEIKEEMQEHLFRRLLQSQKTLYSYLKNNPQQRYKELIEEYPHIVQRIPQHYIASYLGITSVSLSRIRNRR
mgnify:FL=1